MAERDPALRVRVLSALALVPLALLLVWIGGGWFAGFVALAVVLMGLEWGGLTAVRHGRRSGLIAGGAVLLVGVGTILLGALGRTEAAVAGLLAGMLLAALLAQAAGGRPGWTALGVGYIGLPALALLWLRALPELGFAVLLWLLIVVWTTDTAAYFAGRALGGPRLAPAVSPSKTWAGLGGGMVGAALAGALAAWLLGSGRLLQAAGLGALLAVVAQFGDLFESGFKRAAGVKDSGALIPGHGGLLDRIDGLLFAAPALALIGLIAGPEGLPWG